MERYIAIFVTCASKKEAAKIAKRLLSKRLIACANIVGGVESLFRWKGKVDKASEALMIIKTTARNFRKVEKTIKGLHSYEVPEIIGLPIVAGEADYLKWIDESVKT